MALFTVFCLPLYAQHVYDMARFGIQPGKKATCLLVWRRHLQKLEKK